MKKLLDLKGLKVLSKAEQKNINGGTFLCVTAYGDDWCQNGDGPVHCDYILGCVYGNNT